MHLKFRDFLRESSHPGGYEWEKVAASQKMQKTAYDWVVEQCGVDRLSRNGVIILTLWDELSNNWMDYEHPNVSVDLRRVLESWNGKIEALK